MVPDWHIDIQTISLGCTLPRKIRDRIETRIVESVQRAQTPSQYISSFKPIQNFWEIMSFHWFYWSNINISKNFSHFLVKAKECYSRVHVLDYCQWLRNQDDLSFQWCNVTKLNYGVLNQLLATSSHIKSKQQSFTLIHNRRTSLDNLPINAW